MSDISPILSTNLNTSSLPPVFQIPQQKIKNNENINITILPRTNLKPIKNYKSNNLIPVNNMNISTYDNPIFKIRGRPLLKPINMYESRKKITKINNINEVPYEKNENLRNKSLEKFAKTSQYYYQMIQNMQNQMGKTQISKLEKSLRDIKMNNISINQNKNMIGKNIVILKNKQSINNINSYKSNNDIYANKTSYLSHKKNYLNSIQEFIPINKNKTLMLHVPNLKLYYCFIISYNDFEKVEEYIISWKKIEHISVEILCIFDNEEEQNYRIMVEKNKNGNLGNLLKSMGNISEYILKNMTKQLITIIQIYNKKIKIRNKPYYNIFDIYNICFDYRYNIKIFPGELDIKSQDDNVLNEFFDKLNFNKEDPNFQLIIDFFNLGMTLLNCNLKILNCTVKDCIIMNNNNSHNHNENCCCLFHCITKNNNIFENLFQNIQFPNNYFDFLHCLTLFNKDNFNIDNIINHSWLTTNTNNNINPKNNLDELIKLGKLYDFENEYYTSNSNIENFDLLCSLISNKLSSCEEYFNYFSIKSANMIFSTVDSENLSKELKVYEDDIENKLYNIYNKYFINQFNNTLN